MPLTLREYEDSMHQPALCELLPVRDLLDGVMIRTSGAFVAGYELIHHDETRHIGYGVWFLRETVRAEPAQAATVRETLVDLAVTLEAGLALTFECAAAMRTAADEDEGRRLRRILVPLAKVRASRDGLDAAIQGVELHGGNGYMEDWPMARQLRDAQCNTIWEGTENICALDVRRAIRRSRRRSARTAVRRSQNGLRP